MKIWRAMLGLIVSLWINPVYAASYGFGSEQSSLVKGIITEAKKKQKRCNEYCHTAFRTGSFNPLKQIKALAMSSTAEESKCKKLCTGRGYLFVMDSLKKPPAKYTNGLGKSDLHAMKHAVNLKCTEYSRKYLREIFGWSCNRHCAKDQYAKPRGQPVTTDVDMYDGKWSKIPCKEKCKKIKAAYQKLALNYCTGSFSYNPLIKLLHMRQADYAKPVGNIKKEVEIFWKKFKVKVKGKNVSKSPDHVLWNEQDISEVIFQDEEDDESSQTDDPRKKKRDDEDDDEDEELKDRNDEDGEFGTNGEEEEETDGGEYNTLLKEKKKLNKNSNLFSDNDDEVEEEGDL